MYTENAASTGSFAREMRMYEEIVVAFDGSEYSKSALREVSHWIKRHGGKAVIVHAVFFDEEEYGTIPEQLEKRLNFGKKLCDQAKEEISSSLGVDIEPVISEGDPPDIVIDVAQSRKADLIAIGTHGRKGLKKLLMGSVTSGVIANAPCDVLVVKKPCCTSQGAYGSILVPFDGSEFSRKALLRACRMVEIDGGSVTVLYVIPRYEEMVGFFMTAAMKSNLMKEAEKIIAAASELALEKGVGIKAMIDDGDVGSRIAEAAAREKNDLIVMGSYGWSGMNKAVIGGTTERVIMYANCPILVVR